MKILAAIPLFVGKCNLQFQNCNCSYSLSVVNFLEKQLQAFAFAGVTFGTTTFPKELLFQSTYCINFLLWNFAFFGTATVKRIYLKHQMFVIFCLTLMRIFQNSPNKLHINSGSEKTASPSFHAVLFI